jgi:acetyl esterase/lipase
LEYPLTSPEGLLVVPETPRCAVLVLAGSSGRIEADRVRVLAAQGAAAMSIRWFGDVGQPAGINRVPLETFAPALNRLASLSEHLAVVGTSRGAEAALLLSVRDARIRAVAGLSPSSVVWANVGPGADGVHRSAWSEKGISLPFVPYDDEWVPVSTGGQPVYRGLYEQSLRTFGDRVDKARIPVEHIAARVLLTAGGDDLLWPADRFAAEISERRAAHGLATEVHTHADAGHRIRFPGEPASPGGGMALARGGTPEADAEFGRQVWPALLDLLLLR